MLSDGDPGTVRVVSDAAELVGRQLAVVCNLLAPRRVVIVEALAEAGDLVLGPIRTALLRSIAPNKPRSWYREHWVPGRRHSAPSP